MSVHTDPRIGTELVGYALEARVGQGGMGVVYRAYDRRLKRRVALKLIAPELARDERFRERFLRESEVAASLEHPSVVPIHDAGEVDGQLYLAMRYVEGRDLRSDLRTEGALAPARALALCAQVADALDAAHARGLVHRDVKPSNVLLDASDHAYLADFGLSRRLAEQGLAAVDARSLGTPAYVAPEQIEGAPVDGRADVYSLGCLLFECLTGEAPFARNSRLAVVWAHLEEEPPRASERNPALPRAIDAVLQKAMAKSPEERYGSCSELVAAAGDALGLREAARTRGRSLLLLAGPAVLVALAAAVAAFVLTRTEAEPVASAGVAVRANTLVRIDPKTNRLAAAIDLGSDPYAVAGGGESIWAYSVKDRTVIEVDARTEAVRERTAVSTVPVEPGFWAGPLIAADADGAWIVGHTDWSPIERTPRGGGVLTRVHAGGGKNEYRFEDYKPMAVTVADGAVWMLGWRSLAPAVLRIDPTRGAILDTLPLPPDAAGESIAVGEGALWVGVNAIGALVRVDPTSAAPPRSVDLGTWIGNTAVGLGAVWVHIANNLMRLDPRTLRVAEVSRSLPHGRAGSFVLADGSLWWNDMGGGSVLRLDPTTGRIISTIRVTPSGPEGVGLLSTGIAAGGGSIWVTVGAGLRE